VVPSRVSFSIDLRHPDNSVLNGAGARIAVLWLDRLRRDHACIGSRAPHTLFRSTTGAGPSIGITLSRDGLTDGAFWA
jgi:hypothetical protein